MSRQQEIEQGLREEGGALIGGLHVLDYAQGMDDFENGADPPSFTTTSYDLGRARASERAEWLADYLAGERQRDLKRRDLIREMCKDRPDVLADFDAKMAELDARKPQ
jgi:hypothetical protein